MAEMNEIGGGRERTKGQPTQGRGGGGGELRGFGALGKWAQPKTLSLYNAPNKRTNNTEKEKEGKED